jgi:glutathionylspermidine synthase
MRKALVVSAAVAVIATGTVFTINYFAEDDAYDELVKLSKERPEDFNGLFDAVMIIVGSEKLLMENAETPTEKYETHKRINKFKKQGLCMTAIKEGVKNVAGLNCRKILND